jgi:hypothetical protein
MLNSFCSLLVQARRTSLIRYTILYRSVTMYCTSSIATSNQYVHEDTYLLPQLILTRVVELITHKVHVEKLNSALI